MTGYTHLHVHSHYSLLDGLGKIPELLDRAKELNMKSIALTDHGVLYGLVEFYTEARKRNIKPILGLEAYLAPEGIDKRRGKIEDKPRHITLLARNNQGYKNLLKISSISHLKGFYYKPRIDYSILEKHAEGLIVLSGCLNGDIPQAVVENNMEKAEQLTQRCVRMFGKDNFFLELQYHPSLPEQEQANKGLESLSRKLGVPLVATVDVHYVRPADAEAQDVLLCVQTGNTVSEQKRMSMLGEDYSLKPAEEIEKHFRDYPEAIANTARIAEMCNVELSMGNTILPAFPLPEGKDAQSYLRETCESGIPARYGDSPPSQVKERLDYELSVIEKTGFASYFLIVQDFVNWSKKQGILVGPGRGSAAGSIVSYLLNITNLDPLHYDLMFERFLNPARVNMPDIDLDFADDRRDEAIDYVRRKYGEERVAHIITFGTMAARAAVRDTGRALGFPYSFCDKIAKLIPFNSSLKEATDNVPELKEQYNADPQVKKLIDTAKKLEGVCRHASTHAAGVVIGDKELTEYVPLQRASQEDDTAITQYAMNEVESLGLLKIDFLGLKNLTILQNALQIINACYQQNIQLEEIPLTDRRTYETLQKGNTTGVFQLESSGIKRYLRELKPTEFEDIIAMVALYRPGPIELIPEYVAGKHGLKKPTYLHPSLKPILEKTYGIAIYQEQVLQVARDFAGFSLGEADILRKAVGKKKTELLQEQKVKFIEGAINKGVDKETAEKVFAFIEPFAGYGFNLSHATCYAMIAYQTAYLKTHYPAAFMAALLRSDENNTDRVAIEVAECETMGINVLPPDVNESKEHFTVVKNKENKEQEAIRFGLRAVKNVGNNVIDAIISARKEAGSFSDLADFTTRVQSRDFNKKSIESLAKAGAFDSIAERNVILENLELLLNLNRAVAKQAAANQADLFGAAPETANIRPTLTLKETEPASQKQKLAWEKELLGLFVTGHPLADVADALAKVTIPAAEITTDLANSNIRVGGIITKVQRIITRSQKSMAFVTLEDRSASLEVLVFPNILEGTNELWQEDQVILVDGRVSDKEGEVKIIAEEARLLDVNNLPSLPPQMKKISAQKSPEQLMIKIPAKAPKKIFFQLKSILALARQGKTAVILEICRPDNNIDLIKTSFAVNYSSFLRSQIESLLGPHTVKTVEKKREPVQS